MTTIIYISGKKVSKKKAAELIGKELLEKRIEDAKKTFMGDPYILNEWMDGMVIKFGGR